MQSIHRPRLTWGCACRGKLPASLQAVEAEAVLLNKIIQHLITREGIFVVAWSPVQVRQGCCHASKIVYSSLAL